MANMLPSPSCYGYNIPSIGTPDPEEVQILPQSQQHHQQSLTNRNGPSLVPSGTGMGFGSSGRSPRSVVTVTANSTSMRANYLIQPQTPNGMSPSSIDSNEQTSLGPHGHNHLVNQPLSMSEIYHVPSTPTPGSMTPMTPGSASPGMVPYLQNIVSTVNLGCQLDLKQITLHARNAEYNPKRFAAVIMRIREPRTTALIFSSGKMVVTGAKCEEDSRLAARKYARIVQKLGFPAKFLDFKIQNIVGSCDVKFPIRLEGLVLAHNQFSSYEPELFPGLIYRMVKPRIVLLIFVSGKVVLTGAKVRQEIYEAFENIYPILRGFKKQ